ncbi:MAG: NAD(P)H-dependent glycerol-3-phosphate dehydrogenase [Clostridia bacterium]|nr:NAD(P)H-dependent glycerol-3-phosphate dehydrogenase [Clostridia bacterium]
MKIAVIGSGGWGTAISSLLATKGHHVTLWSWKQAESDTIALHHENRALLPGVILPENITYTSNITVVSDADMTVIATPSGALVTTVQAMAPHLKPQSTIVNLTKGLCEETGERFSQVIERLCPGHPVIALTGPSHAEEVGKKIPTAVVAASTDAAAASFVQDAFMLPYFRVYTSHDIIGAELGGALKNIIALCAGIMDGLGLGDNTKAALMTRGLTEMTRLGVAMGAHASTFAGLSGIGDLIVTCTSMHSRNRRAGILIGQGKTVQEALDEVHMVVEGFYAAKSAYRLAKQYKVDMPIVYAAYQVLFEDACPKEAAEKLMTRDKKAESPWV